MTDTLHEITGARRPLRGQLGAVAAEIATGKVLPFRRPRPTMFRVEYGAVVWATAHGLVRFDLGAAKAFRDILLEGGNSDAYFDLDAAILALSDPSPADTVRSMLAASVAVIEPEPPHSAA